MNEKLVAADLWHDTIALVGRHFKIFAVIAGVVVIAPALLSRIMFSEMAELVASGKTPTELPRGYWLYMVSYITVTLVGLNSIAAMAADPEEGNGRTPGAIVRSVFPAIGKALLAALIFFITHVASILVLAITLGIIFAVVAIVTGASSGANAQQMRVFIWIGVAVAFAIVVPVTIWIGSRLSPLTGVYLREPVSVIEGIKRAWVLSDSSAWPIAKLVFVVSILAFALSAFQFGLFKMGLGIGIAGIFVIVAMGGLGALLFVYQAAGMGLVYRRLCEISE